MPVSQLIITHNNEEITFDLHEIVAIADVLIRKFPQEAAIIPHPRDTIEYIAKGAEILKAQGEASFEKLLTVMHFVPTISEINSVGKWLFIAEETSRESYEIRRKGFWFNMGGRLVLKRAEDGYISDYGDYNDIIYHRLDPSFFLSRSDNEKVRNGLNFIVKLLDDHINNRNIDLKVQQALVRFFEERPDVKINEILAYFQECESFLDEKIEAYSFVDKKLPGFSGFIKHLQTEYGNKFSEHVNHNFVFFWMFVKILCGEAAPVFRVDAFGPKAIKDKKGASYQFIESAIDEHVGGDSVTAITLIKQMRDMLGGQTVVTPPKFLATLTVAWFIAETGRHFPAFFMGLLILDLLEAGYSNMPGLQQTYNWSNVLIHPDTGIKHKKVADLYGKRCDPDEWGGLHPMCHSGSFTQCDKEKRDGGIIQSKFSLNMVRQKEGVLLIDWLSAYFRENMPQLQTRVKTVQEIKIPGKLSYESSTQINAAINNIGKKINKLKATIRVKIKANENADISKQGESILKLENERHKLNLKKEVIDELLIPALQKRLSTFVYMLSAEPQGPTASSLGHNNLNIATVVPVVPPTFRGCMSSGETVQFVEHTTSADGLSQPPASLDSLMGQATREVSPRSFFARKSSSEQLLDENILQSERQDVITTPDRQIKFGS